MCHTAVSSQYIIRYVVRVVAPACYAMIEHVRLKDMFSVVLHATARCWYSKLSGACRRVLLRRQRRLPSMEICLRGWSDNISAINSRPGNSDLKKRPLHRHRRELESNAVFTWWYHTADGPDPTMCPVYVQGMSSQSNEHLKVAHWQLAHLTSSQLSKQLKVASIQSMEQLKVAHWQLALKVASIQSSELLHMSMYINVKSYSPSIAGAAEHASFPKSIKHLTDFF